MKSIRARLILSFIALLIITYFISFLGTKIFVKKYYYRNTLNSMINTVKKINTIMAVGTDEEEINSGIEYISYTFTGKISIINSSGKNSISQDDIEVVTKSTSIVSKKIKGIQAYLITTDYPVAGTTWLTYSQLLNNGQIIILQSPTDFIDYSMRIMQTFFLVVSLISLFIALLISIFLSKSISKPINELKKMALELRTLNYKAVHSINRKDEIGQLSVTLEELSNKLEHTINALQYEISKDKEINKLIKTFIQTASHELKTPLTIISGYTEALSDGLVVSEEEKNSYYNVIKSETRKMDRMIKDMLQITLLESSTFSVNRSPFDLKEFFDKIIRDYELLSQKNNIPFRVANIKTSKTYSGDKVRLEQAFRNIINNAFKFSDNKKPVAFVAVNDNNILSVTISNSGPKIDGKDISKIFDIFYKGEYKGGSGIGLAVSSNIFNKHGIDYFVNNTADGVKFTVKIDLNEN